MWKKKVQWAVQSEPREVLKVSTHSTPFWRATVKRCDNILSRPIGEQPLLESKAPYCYVIEVGSSTAPFCSYSFMKNQVPVAGEVSRSSAWFSILILLSLSSSSSWTLICTWGLFFLSKNTSFSFEFTKMSSKRVYAWFNVLNETSRRQTPPLRDTLLAVRHCALVPMSHIHNQWLR